MKRVGCKEFLVQEEAARRARTAELEAKRRANEVCRAGHLTEACMYVDNGRACRKRVGRRWKWLTLPLPLPLHQTQPRPLRWPRFARLVCSAVR